MKNLTLSILSCCIITAVSSMGITSEEHNPSTTNHPSSTAQTHLLFPTNSLLERIPLEVRAKMNQYADPNCIASSSLLDSLQNNYRYNSKLDVAYVSFLFPKSENYSRWDIENHVRLSILAEQPKKIEEIGERTGCDPYGDEVIVTKIFKTFPGNTTFEMYANWYGQNQL